MYQVPELGYDQSLVDPLGPAVVMVREDREWIVLFVELFCGVEPLLGVDLRDNLVFPHAPRIVVVGIVALITDDGVFCPEYLAAFESGKHRREESGVAGRPTVQEKCNRDRGARRFLEGAI